MIQRPRCSFLLAALWQHGRRTFFIIVGAMLSVYIFKAYLHTAQLKAVENSKDVICEQAHTEFKQPIPKIIHQIWNNTKVPEKWRNYQRKCKQMNPQYEYRLWTHEEIEQFLRKYYPWFMDTFFSYQHFIQRVDASRYFILHHHGGFYIDLDMECLVPLDRIVENATVKSDAILAATDPVGITNNFMGAKSGHPFMKLLTHSLLTSNIRRWSPHLTVMLSAGPLFVYRTYLPYSCKDQMHVLTVAQQKVFFHHEQAATWHGWDGPLVVFLDRHQKVLLPLGFTLVIAIALLILFCMSKLLIACKLKSQDDKSIL